MIETDQLGTALDRHSQGIQPFDQHAFVSVLREDQREGERCQTLSHTIQGQPCDLGALHPEVGPRNLDAAIDERAGHPKLVVKLQVRAETARAREVVPGSAVLSMIRTADPEPGQPERQHEPGGAGADDQDLDVGPRSLSAIPIDSHGTMSPRVLVRIAPLDDFKIIDQVQ